MKLALDTRNTKIFIGSKPEVRPVFGWTDGKKDAEQTKDENGVFLWNFDAELIVAGEVESLRMKIASATEPVLKARTEYGVNGAITATPYVVKDTGRVALSINIDGILSIPGAAPKV